MQRLSGGWSSLRLIRFYLIIFLSLGLIFILYFWRLGNLTPGLSTLENSARQSSSDIHSITNQPINAPHKLLQYGFQAAGHPGAFWMRLSSVILAIIFISCFYLLARAWFGRFVGFLSTLLLATTPWIILLSRSASADILLLTPLAIFTSYVFLGRAEGGRRKFYWFWFIASVALGFYVPGVIWLMLGGLVFARQQLGRIVRTLPVSTLTSGVALLLLLIAPLIWAMAHNWTIIKPLLLIPTLWPGTVEVLRSTAWAALALVWRTRQHMDMVIDRLPLLSIIQIVLTIFGLYAMWSRARREMLGLVGLIAFGVLAAGINQDMSLLTIALPAIGLIAAAGLRYLYIEWRQVFPRNPLPKALALILMCSLIILHVLYGIRYSLVAWPHTVDTRSSYVIK